MANRYEHTLLGGSGDMHLKYSALTSNLTALACRTRVFEHAHACTRASTREYSHTHTHTRVLASTQTRTCSRSNACTRFTRSGHASLVPKPSTFFRGGRGLGIDAIEYVFACTACARYSHAHACDVHCTRVRANIHMRVARASHACGFRVTHEWTCVDRQVARERHYSCSHS